MHAHQALVYVSPCKPSHIPLHTGSSHPLHCAPEMGQQNHNIVHVQLMRTVDHPTDICTYTCASGHWMVCLLQTTAQMAAIRELHAPVKVHCVWGLSYQVRYP